MSAKPLVAAAALVVLALLGLGHVTGSMAAFTDSATVTSSTAGAAGTAFTAGTIATPVSPSTAQSPTASVTLTWTATSVGANGGAASTYDVLRYPTATGGQATTVCSGTTALTCVDNDVPAGTVYYSVRARIGDNWVKEGPRKSFVLTDTTPPVVVINTPINGCAAVACGTASDQGGGTVAKIEYTLQRKRVGKVLGTTLYSCWNGSAWTAETLNETACAFGAATGTTSWTVPGSNSTAYQNNGLYTETYTLVIRATDSFGNVSTSPPTGFTRP